jgi:hypothetical protein
MKYRVQDEVNHKKMKEDQMNINNVDQSFNEFAKALKQGLPVSCQKNGQWIIESRFMNLVRNRFSLNESRLLSIAHTLENLLDRAEKIPVQFSSAGNVQVDQKAQFADFLEASEIVVELLKNLSEKPVVEWKHRLQRKMIGLKYRLESVNGGLDKGDGMTFFSQLVDAAVLWKQEHPIFSDKTLTNDELKIISETSQYQEFVQFLLGKNGELQDSFFEWILRDKNSVAPFIQFPAMQKKIIEHALNGRIGRIGGCLQILKRPLNGDKLEKVLTLPMEGRPVSILDETAKVTFRGNYTLCIQEIFEVFKNKVYTVGNLEFLAEGIINWNAHHLGWWDADQRVYHKIDPNQPSWWEQLPPFETITLEDARIRYALPLEGIQWVVGAKATRGSRTLDIERTHAFMEVAIPREDKSYAIYNFGKFAFQFPSSFFNSLLTFCLNMHATVAYPDENVFYSQRQHGCYSLPMTSEQGLKLMNLIKEDIVKSRENNFLFQIESENCAKWLYEKLIAIFGNQVPNLFKMSLMKTEPVGFVGACFNLFRTLGIPQMTQFKLVALFHIPFGAWKGTEITENGNSVIKKLTNHDFWTSSEVYLPALLIAQLEAGHLPKSTESIPVNINAPAEAYYKPPMMAIGAAIPL